MLQQRVNAVKAKEVQDVKRLASEYPVIAVVNMETLPAKELLKIKHSLRGKVVFKYTKKRLIKIAFDQLKDQKKNIESFKEKVIGIPMLLFTKENPYALQKLINKNKSATPAKPGQIAPYDLIMPAGPTPFAPGPMIGELGVLGIKSKVQDGKICVISDTVLVHQGDAVSPKAAELLAKIGVEPMEIGLSLVVAYENGELLEHSVLAIDEKVYLNNIMTAHQQALGLAISIAYPTKETVELLVAKAHRQAKGLEDATLNHTQGVIVTAEKQAEVLSSAVSSA